MNWEYKGKKETTQEHYGKRGIPWHGFFGFYYRYIPETGSFERIVIKVDQILDGDALKNGSAVLSLLECFLVAVEGEFMFLRKAIFQSDNAACYHKKELVLGIAFLNVMAGRMIRITRFTHTETQDGKSLLDAHFARGTKQVIKYIKTCSSVQNKKVASSIELAMALAWNGGIQNSSVQHVKIARDHLNDFAKVLGKCSKDALESFSRANDIFYLSESNCSEYDTTDAGSWESVSFQIRVFAYSGIGRGAAFKCDCGQGTFQYLGADFLDEQSFVVDEEEEEEEDDAIENDIDDVIEDDISEYTDGLRDPEDLEFSAETDTDGDILRDLAALFEGEITRCKRHKFGDAKKLPLPSEAEFKKENLFSRAEILGASPFGAIDGKVIETDGPPDKASKQSHDAKELDQEYHNPARAALPRALRLVPVLVANNCVKIRSGKDDQIAEYRLARDFILDQEHFPRGWARRPLSGKIYGVSYIEEFLDEIRDWVIAGNKDKNDKKNPRQMYLALRERHKKYAIPLEHELRGSVGHILKSLETEAGKKAKSEKKPKLPEHLLKHYTAITDEMKQKVRQTGWQFMKPMEIFERIVYTKKVIGSISTAKSRKKAGIKSGDEFSLLSKCCREKFSAWKSTRKHKRERLTKMALV